MNINEATKEDLLHLYKNELKTMKEICEIYKTYHSKLSQKFKEFRIEPIIGNRTQIHGMRNTRIYKSWHNMKNACNCKSAGGYKYIGGIGISYTSDWDLFIDFYEDMKDGYDDSLFLTRRDKNLDYTKENCYWGSMDDIRYNAKSSIVVKIGNEEMTVRQASKKFGIKEKTIQSRYEKGWRGLRLVEEIKEDYVTNIPHMKEFYESGGVFKPKVYSDFSEDKKEIIRSRDNYTCQECGISNKKSIEEFGHSLHVHHIDYNKQNSLETNLISLCARCHGATNIYNRDKWEKRYTDIVNSIIRTT